MRPIDGGVKLRSSTSHLKHALPVSPRTVAKQLSIRGLNPVANLQGTCQKYWDTVSLGFDTLLAVDCRRKTQNLFAGTPSIWRNFISIMSLQ